MLGPGAWPGAGAEGSGDRLGGVLVIPLPPLGTESKPRSPGRSLGGRPLALFFCFVFVFFFCCSAPWKNMSKSFYQTTGWKVTKLAAANRSPVVKSISFKTSYSRWGSWLRFWDVHVCLQIKEPLSATFKVGNYQVIVFQNTFWHVCVLLWVPFWGWFKGTNPSITPHLPSLSISLNLSLVST